jgi:hypothetical protein
MLIFLSGVLAMGYFIIGLFFMRFWKQTRDRLFLMFGLAFWILTFQRTALFAYGENHENTTFLYVVRLLAFVLILAAIIDKNRATASKRDETTRCDSPRPAIESSRDT